MKIKNWPFTTWLGIVSIIGFLAIIVESTTGFDTHGWAQSLLFIIIGVGLFFLGGAKFFRYFDNGLTTSEINRLVTVAVGISSIITGILIAPFLSIQTTVVNGLKLSISILAIIVIAIESFYGKKK